MPFDLTLAQALWMGFVLGGAAFVRGYSGFGFAALVVSGASLVTDPLHFVPVVVLADFLLTATQAREIRTSIDWRRAGALFAGCLVGVPVGVWAMSQVGVDTARAAISLFILAMCGVLLAGWRIEGRPGRAAHMGVGLASGLANGAAVGGLPVAAFFSAQAIPAATFRATLIAYFTALDLWTLPIMGGNGMITRDTFAATALAFPLLLVGLWLGSRRFHATSPANFRRFAIVLLATLAALGLAKALA